MKTIFSQYHPQNFCLKNSMKSYFCRIFYRFRSTEKIWLRWLEGNSDYGRTNFCRRLIRRIELKWPKKTSPILTQSLPTSGWSLIIVSMSDSSVEMYQKIKKTMYRRCAIPTIWFTFSKLRYKWRFRMSMMKFVNISKCLRRITFLQKMHIRAPHNFSLT